MLECWNAGMLECWNVARRRGARTVPDATAVAISQHSSIWHYVDHFRPTTLGSLSVHWAQPQLGGGHASPVGLRIPARIPNRMDMAAQCTSRAYAAPLSDAACGKLGCQTRMNARHRTRHTEHRWVSQGKPPSVIHSGFTMVPRTGLEPVIPCGRRFLKPLRMPFRHLGGGVLRCSRYRLMGCPVDASGKSGVKRALLGGQAAGFQDCRRGLLAEGHEDHG